MTGDATPDAPTPDVRARLDAIEAALNAARAAGWTPPRERPTDPRT